MRSLRPLLHFAGLTVVLVCALVLPGCGQPESTAESVPDEAMKRARAEGKDPANAAREYFLPDYYFDPKHKAEIPGPLPVGPGNRQQYLKSDAAPKTGTETYSDAGSNAAVSPDADDQTSKKSDLTTSPSHVPNYLRGMDVVAVLPEAVPADPRQAINQLKTPVYQLLDQQSVEDRVQEFVFADAVQTNSEILGRNTWMLWCGGNEGFWDWLATDSLGFIDLLKLLDTRGRQHRFRDGGLINEPGMVQGGHPDEWGLWLDVPADRLTRDWRKEYVEGTFKELLARKHPAQQGLFEDGAYGKPGDAGTSSYGDAAERSYPPDGYDASAAGSVGESYQDGAKNVDSWPPPSIYGVSSGIVGLRLFPNPYFDEAAKAKWDPERYYEDPDYYSDPELIRPYRVGVACAYCHASFHPLHPPRDVTNPAWENISGSIGAQYLRIRMAFGNQLQPKDFVYHLLDSQPPGTIDTSLIASDSINNPNTMNAVFSLPQRVLMSFHNPPELQSPASTSQPSLWRGLPPDANVYDPDPVPPFYVKLLASQGIELTDSISNPRPVARILLDGSDSIGAWGALARVYLNIGTYYEQWNRLHRPVIGFKEQQAFTIAACNHNSVYWHATQDRVAALRDYFLKVTPPMPLAAAVVGVPDFRRLEQQDRTDAEKAGRGDEPTPEFQVAPSQLAAEIQLRLDQPGLARVDKSQLEHGRKVFARNCIVCHSSIQPESSAVTLFPSPDQKPELEAWKANFKALVERRKQRRVEDAELNEFWEHDPGQWLRDSDYLRWAESIVEKEDFWRLNYLSTDYRIPVTLAGTNSGRAMATNALEKSMWDDFTSESFQHLPSVGAIDYFNPYSGSEGKIDQFTPRHRVRQPDGADNDPKQLVPEGGGGPGFYRVPSLVSLWATGPYLHNNSLGTFTNDPSVAGRMESFDDGIRKLLWPAERLKSSSYNGATPERLKRDQGLIWRTPHKTEFIISGQKVPALLAAEVASVMEIQAKYPWLRAVRPIWLPSALLLLASFLILVVDSSVSRRRIGWATIGAAGLCFLLALLHRGYGWFDWVETVHPVSLPGAILLATGSVILSLDCVRTLRYVAFGALAVGILGLILNGIGSWSGWEWVESVGKVAPLGWLCLILVLGAGLLLATQTSNGCRHRVAVVLLAFACVGVMVFLQDAVLDWYQWSATLGPVWLYSVLLAAASLVLFAPDRQQLSRYVGYSSLLLSLLVGGTLYFFNGELGNLRIGPIPAGTPVNLLANLNPDADPAQLADALTVTLSTFAEIESRHLDEETTQRLLRERVAPALMAVNKCPDFVMDKGHYYEWFDTMTDGDKLALIELLKTF